MTRIAIVGGGRAATLHAEAASATAGVELVGVGGHTPGTADTLAAAAGVPDLPLAEMIGGADGLVVAVPSSEAPTIVAALPAEMPVLVESPVRLVHDRAHAMTGANLLHAAMVKRGLRAIADLGEVHHLVLRGQITPRPYATDVFAEPWAGAWPVLLAAAQAPVTTVAATADERRAEVRLALADGRVSCAELAWTEPGVGVATTEIEAAGATGVVTIGLWPRPSLEIDGRPITAAEEHPLVAMGFVEQMRRFAMVCERRNEPWPPLSVGIGVTHLTDTAARSAAEGGAEFGL